MKFQPTEDYLMDVEVTASVIIELDELNVGVLDTLKNLIDRLLENDNPQNIDDEFSDCINAISSIQAGGVDFDDGYTRLCQSFDNARRLIESGGEAVDDETRPPEIELSPGEREEVELQLDVIDGLLEDESAIDEHVYEVIQNLLNKITSVSSPGDEIESLVSDADETLEKLIAGSIDGEQGISVLRAVVDKLRRACDCGPSPDDEQSDAVSDAAAGVDVVVSDEAAPESVRPSLEKTTLKLSDGEIAEFTTEVYDYVDFAETALLTLEKDTSDSESLNEVFRCFHNIKGITGFMNVADMNKLSHHAESLMDQAREGKVEFAGAIAEVVFEALDFIKEMTVRIEVSNSGVPYATPDGLANLIDGLKDPGSFSYQSKIGAIDAAGNRPEGLPARDSSNSESTVGRNAPGKTDASAKAVSAKVGSIRVTTERLDNLVDSVGELVIANSVVHQGIADLNGGLTKKEKRKLIQDVSHLSKISRELQELAMSMRMVPLAATFNKMARVARDTFMKSGVSGEFTYSGEDTEIDRNVVEELAGPLMHMIRNSIDHGIEEPHVRLAAGKPEKGRVRLSAEHEGGNVVIRIEDDGKGLDHEAILAKAGSLGIIEPGVDLSEDTINNLIFHPGFSTAKEVTDVSGRGVGMDVVRQNIEQLRGDTEIVSRPGEGCSFTIRLPLTLAIIDGMMVSVGDEKFIVPTISIQESIRPSREQLSSVLGRGEMLNVRGELVPLFRLHEIFNVEDAKTDPREGLALLIGVGKRCALLVDELLGQRQVVIKKLGNVFDEVEGVAGGAIMGDGNVALIIDPVGINKMARAKFEATQ